MHDAPRDALATRQSHCFTDVVEQRAKKKLLKSRRLPPMSGDQVRSLGSSFPIKEEFSDGQEEEGCEEGRLQEEGGQEEGRPPLRTLGEPEVRPDRSDA
ncbi:MAG: hypothetical protein JNL90_08440 [Planctomycetes bacterium]|nr:hypothetical protein [Planctomycetota bacterium]